MTEDKSEVAHKNRCLYETVTSSSRQLDINCDHSKTRMMITIQVGADNVAYCSIPHEFQEEIATLIRERLDTIADRLQKEFIEL